ncbi:exostosin family protein, partial [Reticulomyxa filosa]
GKQHFFKKKKKKRENNNNNFFKKKKKYLLELKKPHLILFGRIGYETHQITRKGTPFWNDKLYVVASIDRNCHGIARTCVNRFSIPHPSIFHPKSIESLQLQIERSQKLERDILVSFCGAVRSEIREKALKNCQWTYGWRKWVWFWDGELCVFDDSLKIEEQMKREGLNSHGERRRRLELAFSRRCMKLYERSVFCIQQGADSTTRKGLWDGIVAGCIPVFLEGVMMNEFECYTMSGNVQPWYVITHYDYYVKQLMALSPQYVHLLRRNILRMIPKFVYTDGTAGFHDAIDVLFACLVRLSHHMSDPNNCTYDEMYKRRWFDIDSMLGYQQLYPKLGI